MQAINHLAGRASPPHSYDPYAVPGQKEAGHDLSGGVPQERVDPHTLQVLEQLFGTKGLQFLAAFLRLAEAKQHALADIGIADCAVITAKTIRELAGRIGWSYDTTEKYLVVLCALQFLHKEKSAQGMIYSFPLHRYTPQQTSLDALETVIGNYRPKVQSFARKAKRRLLVSLQGQKSPIVPVVARESLPPAFDLSAAEADIERIMQEELGTGTLPQRLLLKLKGVLRYRCQLYAQTGDSADTCLPDGSPISEQKGNFPSISLTQESSVPKKGDFSPGEGSQVFPAAQTGDLVDSSLTGKSPISTKGNSFVAVVPRNGRLSEQTGDSPSVASGPASLEKSPISEQKGDSEQVFSPGNGRLSAETGDFSRDAGPLPTYNVNHLINTITSNNVIRRDEKNEQIARFLASVFEKNEYEKGKHTMSKYITAFKTYSPEVIGRAFLVTMVLLHRRHWRVDKPGGLFTKQCMILSGKESFIHYTLADVEEWLKAWGDVPYAELITTLATPEPESIKPEPARLVEATGSRTDISSATANKRPTGSSGYSNAYPSGKPKRTYGMHYTGDAIILNKGTNNWGSPGPPSGKS